MASLRTGLLGSALRNGTQSLVLSKRVFPLSGLHPALSHSTRLYSRRENSASEVRYEPIVPPMNFGINFVPTQSAYIIERFGRYHQTLEPGLNFIIPIIDKIAYVQSLKEIPIEIVPQMAITADNVGIEIDGVLYIRVFDPYKASYGVEDATYAISQLAQTTMRSEIGALTLDQSLKERAMLNSRITQAVNEATHDWGVRVMRYEIKNINPPESVIHSMHLQVSAERTKRAQILEAEGTKQSSILVSEARQLEQINVARGEAQATTMRAEATAQALRQVGQAINMDESGGRDAVALRVAEKWVEAFSKLAKENNTLIIPADAGNAGSIIAQALSIFGAVSKNTIPQTAPPPTETARTTTTTLSTGEERTSKPQ